MFPWSKIVGALLLLLAHQSCRIGHIWPFGTLLSGSEMMLISSEYVTIHHPDAVTLIW